MTMKEFSYFAQLYRPREGAEQLLLFVAPASAIREWAGVPRKAFDYQHGFQRTLEDRRIKQVADFFTEDIRNVTPTSVVVGFMGEVKVKPVSAEFPDFVQITITMPDFEAMDMPTLATQARDVLAKRLGTDVVGQIDSNLKAAVMAVVQKEVDETAEEGVITPMDEVLTPPQGSYLADFYTRVSGYLYGVTEWPEDSSRLRSVLYSFLKPGIIVDGQHRVFGAASADEQMKLSVCAIPEAGWAESVYQFVVINQKAKPIKPAFLSTIIATSLNDHEIASVYKRLDASAIDVNRSEIMERVNRDTQSPFAGMIDFEVQGAAGFLQFPGMATLVNKFGRLEKDYPNLLLNASWSSVTGDWLEHFFAFWNGVRDYFETADARLWQRPTPSNPQHLLMIVTLQEIQVMVLENWADSRMIQLTTPEKTREFAKAWWRDFPSTFFTDEWKKKGLQTTVGRGMLRQAMVDTRRNIGRKSWGHRRLSLFQD